VLAAVAPHLFTTGHLSLRSDQAEWLALAEAFAVPASSIRVVKQVHRAGVAVARRGDPFPWTMPEADVVVSDDPHVVIAVRVADCAPVLLADPVLGVVAAVHAGWRGTVRRAVVAGVEALAGEFGSRPDGLVAAIGPCLGVCCGEVGDEVREAFGEAGFEAAAVERWFSRGPGSRDHLHLARANRDQLIAAGVPAANVAVADLCTRSYPELFHSYRAAGPEAGRMAAFIKCPTPLQRNAEISLPGGCS
jgi:YfiH family protein